SRVPVRCSAILPPSMWRHNYEPIGGSLAASSLAAAVPIAVLFLMLGVLRKPAWMSALAALASAFIVALAVYGMPVQLAVISTLYGAAYGLFPIAWIVFSSIMLYRLAVDTGKFEIIKDSVGSLTDDRRLQALFIAFSFGAFIEGAAGFGRSEEHTSELQSPYDLSTLSLHDALPISTLYGAAYGLFPIAWIVFSSIMLYRLAVDTGKFEIIKDSVGSLTDDRRLQALFIAFSFGAFIEGAAGFG